MQLLNIPAELRARPQWCACGPDKVPIDPKTRRFAAVDDPSTWGTFEQAMTAGFKHVGYMLSKDDPYAIIDLDNKVENPAPPEELERHEAIVNALDSYTERSASGRGTHIIVRGNVPKGVRRGHVELYSDGRFMICTGDVLRAKPVADRQELIANMWSQMNPTNFVDLSEDGPEEFTDREIHERALAADNGDKYDMLTRNDVDWRDHYESQSEADNALISMLTFYSKNNDQVRRMFRMSPLGQREKAQRADYVDRSIRLSRTRQAEREPPPVDFKLATEIANTVRAYTPAHPDMIEDVFTFPPGLVGDVARYVMSSSMRPVKEIALATALSLMAGISARTYNTVTKSGLNLYTILLAKTGCGKEAAQNAIERIIAKVGLSVPSINEFIGPSHFASGQAVIKTLNEFPCFLSVLGEIGITLQTWCDPRANSAEQLILRVLLDCYGKSGAANVIRPHVYSDKDKNTSLIQAPNLSILGESVPSKFYESLEASHIESGLVPRFLIIEYEGDRPDENEATDVEPDPQMVQALADLATTVIMAKHNNIHHVVPMEPDAMKHMREFSKFCDEQIRGDDDIQAQLWNRAHLNALRVATLVAVGANYRDPRVTLECAQWATALVSHCVRKVLSRFTRGTAGKQQRDEPLDNAIIWYLRATPKQRLDYKATRQTAETDIMPFNYFRNRLKRVAAYRDDRRGLDVAIKAQLDVYCEIGYLRKLTREESVKLGSTIGGLYAVGPEFAG